MNRRAIPARVKAAVFARDRGICQLCGLDIAKLGRILAHVASHARRWAKLVLCGTSARQLWECDHLVPVCQGGTNRPENLRVLCPTCHHEHTADTRPRCPTCKRCGGQRLHAGGTKQGRCLICKR